MDCRRKAGVFGSGWAAVLNALGRPHPGNCAPRSFLCFSVCFLGCCQPIRPPSVQKGTKKFSTPGFATYVPRCVYVRWSRSATPRCLYVCMSFYENGSGPCTHLRGINAMSVGSDSESLHRVRKHTSFVKGPNNASKTKFRFSGVTGNWTYWMDSYVCRCHNLSSILSF